MAGPGRPPLDRAELDPVLEAVLRVSATSSSRQITLKQIAAEAGVSVGKLQHHFGTRDELVREAFEHHLLGITRRLDGLRRAEGSAVERMARLADEVAEHRSWQRSTLWIDLLGRSIDSIDYRKTVQEINRAWNGVFAELIRDGVRTGEFSVTTSAEDAAARIVAMADGLTVLVVTAGADRSDAERGRRRDLLAQVIESAVGVRI